MSKTCTDPKPVLKKGAVYFADNGRAICFDCAGCSALYTGRDISGQRVQAATVADAREWAELVPSSPVLRCECGKAEVKA